ncbi:hypothetical protein NA57DRAFT_60707 [Rhizodiscina lignyota]|uniref:Uncharacterized protein n=1 Tax=Rhizodiscina lignyota TaxID=1504668 RepID=A0A9P4M5Q5_9PEZI|nr:hypothetical protein NA57DRAFT_60707 [Rhizodiscina lignyota]
MPKIAKDDISLPTPVYIPLSGRLTAYEDPISRNLGRERSSDSLRTLTPLPPPAIHRGQRSFWRLHLRRKTNWIILLMVILLSAVVVPAVLFSDRHQKGPQANAAEDNRSDAWMKAEHITANLFGAGKQWI